MLSEEIRIVGTRTHVVTDGRGEGENGKWEEKTGCRDNFTYEKFIELISRDPRSWPVIRHIWNGRRRVGCLIVKFE
ncbi:MAG: hypothetical protein FWE38_04085 [Firmicutes bacterium]|nr:hypothetical protein [Bacillota bacterium]